MLQVFCKAIINFLPRIFIIPWVLIRVWSKLFELKALFVLTDLTHDLILFGRYNQRKNMINLLSLNRFYGSTEEFCFALGVNSSLSKSGKILVAWASAIEWRKH